MLQKVIKVVAQNDLRQLLPGQDGEPMSGRSFKEIDDPQIERHHLFASGRAQQGLGWDWLAVNDRLIERRS